MSASSTPKKSLAERIVDAEVLGSRWLADGNDAAERGDKAKANPRPGFNLPTLDELKKVIIDTLDDEQQEFPTFQAFFDWWDVVTAYDGMDVEDSNAAYRPLLEVAYRSLVHEGRVSA